MQSQPLLDGLSATAPPTWSNPVKARSWLFSLAVILLCAPSARAQTTAPLDSSAIAVAGPGSAPSVHMAVPSAIDAAPAAVHRNTAVAPNVGIATAQMQGHGESKAMMGVGIASFVAGALIGGDSGKIIMVASAVVGCMGSINTCNRE